MQVEVEVEYCGKCGYFEKYKELVHNLKERLPEHELKIKGHEGRSSTFEVKVNGVLVHSKLNTLAYPDYNDLSEIIKDAAEGNDVRSCDQQPITDFQEYLTKSYAIRNLKK